MSTPKTNDGSFAEFESINAVVAAISKLAGRFESELSSAAAGYALSTHHVAVLFALSRGGQMRTSTLSRLLECDSGNFSGYVDRLEADGLVERSVAANDRRVRLLALTSAGSKVAAKLERRLGASPLLSALRTMQPKTLHGLRSTLEQLIDAGSETT